MVSENEAAMRHLFTDAALMELSRMPAQYIGFRRVLAVLLRLDVASCRAW